MANTPGAPMDDGVGDLDHRIGNADTWNSWLAVERDRFGRYGRPCTVVSIEIVGIDVLARWFGDEIVREAVDAVLSAVVRRTRESDLVALTGTGQVGVILPETDEVAAIHVINRVGNAYDAWNESWIVSRSTQFGTAAARLAMGWASAGSDRDFDDAVKLAAERRADARRRLETAHAGMSVARSEAAPAATPG
jgi:PleD family two-component response regulator